MSSRRAWLLAGLCAPALLAGCAAAGPRASPAPGAPGDARRYLCFRAAEAPVIDGQLDDDAWRRAPWSEAFVDIRGAQMPAPRYETRMKLLWDDEHFYVAARLEEPHVRAAMTRRDQPLFQENAFEVFIDPDGDAREYYEIQINACNNIFDLFLVRTYRDGGPALRDWDMHGLRSAVHVDGTLNDPRDRDAGWSLEMALPWRSLREAAQRPAPPNEGDEWRMNFSRVAWRQHVVDGRYRKLPGAAEEYWVWSPQGEINMHLPQQWGYVRFVTEQE